MWKKRAKGKAASGIGPGYRFYSRFWHFINPLRLFRIRLQSRLRKLLAKLGLLESLKKVLQKKDLLK